MKKKKFAQKERSRIPVYAACGLVAAVIIFAVGAWIGVSIYLEHHRTRQIQEQELGELERRRKLEENKSAFLVAQQQLDEANLQFRKKKEERDRAAIEELDRQNRELLEKRQKATQEAAKELKERNDQIAKEAQEKEKAAEKEKQREVNRKKQLEMIEEDHKTILAYKKIHIKGKGTIRDVLWSPPLRAMSMRGKEDDDSFVAKEGLLYRLQGVVGDSRTLVSYYFFVVNRECVAWQSAKSNSAVTICKIVGDLPLP